MYAHWILLSLAYVYPDKKGNCFIQTQNTFDSCDYEYEGLA